jgi:BirA family biotin operon repressor/biotin-[acetyl-CoA-carboxylase] ligase
MVPVRGEGSGYDGRSAGELARACGVPAVALYDSVASTMDVAHELAASGAPAGTVVLTDRQTAGRGRSGRTWHSAPGDSITLTLVERPVDPAALRVLSLRLGLAAAPVLDHWTAGPVRLKWPNDLMVGEEKLGGVLVEARWRDQQPEWVAIGVGVNVRRPPLPGTAGLAPGAGRVEILAGLVPALRAAAAAAGALGARELGAFEARDWARGRRIVEPAAGLVHGISSGGALLVSTATGIVSCASGSLVPAEAAHAPGL